nr:MAG TPA: hypothetical protein [Caudoviricetes sp.]
MEHLELKPRIFSSGTPCCYMPHIYKRLARMIFIQSYP